MPTSEFEEFAVEYDGLKITGRAAGCGGPVFVFVHGFPDFWGSLVPLAEALNPAGRNVFLDLPGYNNAAVAISADDLQITRVAAGLDAAIRSVCGGEVTWVGHDWGGAIAWWLWLRRASGFKAFVSMSAPHPASFFRSMNDPAQWETSAYARELAKPDAGAALDIEVLSRWAGGSDHRDRLLQVLRRSSPQAMAGYYRANYPQRQDVDPGKIPVGEVPFLLAYGIDDPYIATTTFSGSADYGGGLLSLAPVSGGHFIHYFQMAEVSDAIQDWRKNVGQAE
ncbi:alpha/beta fold hydrolase [Oricola sp.]|uniref:alpha/beta fold hydrolase n=1 Tax=Oricola sp. TaxID=1979950 RepID=UPI003BA92CFD